MLRDKHNFKISQEEFEDQLDAQLKKVTLDQQAKAGSWSFPSGHTSSAFALATSLSIVYPKWYVIVPSYLWASSVGYSRMHLGVHYPSDVLAGALVGTGSAFLSHALNKCIHKKVKENSKPKKL